MHYLSSLLIFLLQMNQRKYWLNLTFNIKYVFRIRTLFSIPNPTPWLPHNSHPLTISALLFWLCHLLIPLALVSHETSISHHLKLMKYPCLLSTKQMQTHPPQWQSLVKNCWLLCCYFWVSMDVLGWRRSLFYASANIFIIVHFYFRSRRVGGG